MNPKFDDVPTEILQAISKRIAEVVEGGANPRFGLCANINDAWANSVFDEYSGEIPGWLEDGPEVVREFSIGWPHHSGDDYYPIPGGEKAYFFHTRKGTLWTGEQRDLRISLAEYLLQQVTEALEHRSKGGEI